MGKTTSVVSFSRRVLGVELHPRQIEALRGVASRPLSVLCLGRRSGKTLLACIWAAYDAVVLDPSTRLRPGEPRYIVVVATAQDQARNSFRVIRGFFDLPKLCPLVLRETADELWLATGVCIKCLPCSARSTRGLAISTVVFDELAHFVDTEGGYQAGEQVFRALAPSVAQFGDEGRLICLSTPRGQRGVFWRLWNLGDDSIYQLQAPTSDMNPLISQTFLDRERQRDPGLFSQEYEAEFLAGGGAFLDLATLEGAVGVTDHAHKRRVLALDPAFHRDSFAVALVCKDDSGFHVEEVRVWEPPVGFGEAMDAVAALAVEFGPSEVITDQFAAAPIVAELRRRGVRCKPVTWTAQKKSEAFSLLKASLNTGRLRLVDDARLLRELSNLVATPTALGFAVEGESDDLAAAVALAVWRLETHRPGRMLLARSVSFGSNRWRRGLINCYLE